MKLSKEMNSWLMVLVVLLTAAMTSWVMLKGKSSQALNSVYSYPPQQMAWNFAPGLQAMDGGAFLVAGTTGVPVIRAGAIPMHADRGVCTGCHTVVSSRGYAIPNISASSTLTHENRTVCSNCHLVVPRGGLDANTGSPQAAIPVAAVGQVVAPRTTAPSRTATEGEWMGMEVAPITSVTASQYGIPQGTPGLVVAEAETTAAATGLRAGDVVLSVNGMPTSNMTGFFQATQNGALTQGVVEVLRGGQRLSMNIAQTTNPATAAVPNSPVSTPSVSPSMPTPQDGSPVYPGNAAAWGGGQGLGNDQGWGPGVPCPRQF